MHRAVFEVDPTDGAMAVGIARPMDSRNKAMCKPSLLWPSNPDVTAKHPAAWRGEHQLNAVP